MRTARNFIIYMFGIALAVACVYILPRMRAFETLNVPIHFWGKIVDIDGKPIPKVHVRAKVRTWFLVPAAGSRFPKYDTYSDAYGRFEFDHLRGDVLEIEALEKDGYEAEPISIRGYGFNTSDNVVTSQNTPVKFRMWKQAENVSLSNGERIYRVDPNGNILSVNLLSNDQDLTPSKESDLRLWIKRPPEVKFGQRYDWTFGIEAVAGGLIEQTNTYDSMWLAPADGYTNSCRIEIHAQKNGGWGYAISGLRFYIKTRDGKIFGRIVVDARASSDGVSGGSQFRIEYAINTAGGRILKP